MNKSLPKMKTLNDIKLDMSELYEKVNDDHTDLKKAAELANIAGKFLKAEQLLLARQIFTSHLGDKIGVEASAQLTHNA